MFTQLVKARNLRLNRVMSEVEFNDAVNDLLVDWDLAKGLTQVEGPQQTPVVDAGSSNSPSADVVIQPDQSFNTMLASGEYAAPDLIHHVCNLQYAPLPMFAVKEMHEHHLSNTAYLTRTEVDTITSKKKTVVNTDDFAMMECSIS